MAEYALAQGAEVFGSSRWRSKSENIDHLRSRITLIESDLRDLSSVRALVELSNPSHVIHLAAQSFVGASWHQPAETLSTNVISQVNLLESIRGLRLEPRFLAVGSSEEYGMVYEDELPIRETNPLRPLSPYAVSKVAQDLLALQYHLSHGLPAIRVRPFNHAGPRQAPQFAIASFAQQIARIELGKQEPTLKVGNLDARRDFTDVRDIARAYLLAVAKGKPGEVYNLGSGSAPRLRDVLARLLTMTRVRVTLEVDPARTHGAEADVYICDARRFQRLTGWRPRIALDRTLRDTLNYWRHSERSVA